jgi:WD40 repeat protein
LPSSLAFSPDGRLLVVGRHSTVGGFAKNGTPMVIDFDAKTISEVAGSSSARSQIEFSADGKSAVISTCKGTSRRFTSNNKPRIAWENLCEYQSYSALAWAVRGDEFFERGYFEFQHLSSLPSGKQVLIVARDRSVELRELASDLLLWSAPLTPSPELSSVEGRIETTALRASALSPDGTWLVTYEVESARFEKDTPWIDKGYLVVRRGTDGAVLARYAASDVANLLVTPDGKNFVYTTDSNQTFVAMVPLEAKQPD